MKQHDYFSRLAYDRQLARCEQIVIDQADAIIKIEERNLRITEINSKGELEEYFKAIGV